MKKLLASLTLAILAPGVEAGDHGCFLFPKKKCTTTTTTQWYKAKDGTYREMMPYAKALSRAEDADDMEIALRKTEEELSTAKATAEKTSAELAATRQELESTQAEMAKFKAAMEAQVAELKKQLAAETQSVASQKDRADKAEAAHKSAVGQLATLRETAVKSEETQAQTLKDLAAAAQERDALKIQVNDVQKAQAAAEAAAKTAQEELEQLKKAVEEGKKIEKPSAETPGDGKVEEQPKVEGEQPATEPAPSGN